VTDDRLYRGVNLAQHRGTGGRLVPRAPGAFEHTFMFDGTIYGDGSATGGASAQNAVLAHQLGLPDRPDLHTAGISTTPHVERAPFYATHVLVDGRWQQTVGVIYVIDRARLGALGISEHVVSDTVYDLSIKEPLNAEVILVARDGGELPASAIIEIIEVEN